MPKNRVIVIGTSAGGLDALFRIVPFLSRELQAPILIVQHIGAHRSVLPELLSARSPLPASFAQDGERPQPGTIYVAPPDRHLLLENGSLRLFRGPKEHFARPAIDPLFRSAALHSGRGVVGVILTGMLEDGSAGLHAIEACGGTTIVQDPHEAVEPSMPRSAIQAVQADYVVRVDTMADLLNKLAEPCDEGDPVAPEWLRAEHAISLGQGRLEELKRIAAPSGFTCPDCGGSLFELQQGKPVRFLCHTGHAFGLRSLATAQELLTEETLWAGLRALQEKEAILRRLGDVQASTEPNSGAKTLAEADSLAVFIAQMHAVIRDRTPKAPLEI